QLCVASEAVGSRRSRGGATGTPWCGRGGRVVIEYDTWARSLYANCVPPYGAAPKGSPVGCGAMAQLVARLHGMQKVRGSNPLSSTAFFGSLFDGKAPNQEPRQLGQPLSSFSSPKTLSITVALLRIAVGQV